MTGKSVIRHVVDYVDKIISDFKKDNWESEKRGDKADAQAGKIGCPPVSPVRLSLLGRRIEKRRRVEEAFLFYQIRLLGRWLCAVAKRLDGEGFLATAYKTGSKAEGNRKALPSHFYVLQNNTQRYSLS